MVKNIWSGSEVSVVLEWLDTFELMGASCGICPNSYLCSGLVDSCLWVRDQAIDYLGGVKSDH